MKNMEKVKIHFLDIDGNITIPVSKHIQTEECPLCKKCRTDIKSITRTGIDSYIIKGEIEK